MIISDRDTSSLRLVESIRIQTTAGAYLQGWGVHVRHATRLLVPCCLLPCEPRDNRDISMGSQDIDGLCNYGSLRLHEHFQRVSVSSLPLVSNIPRQLQQ